MTITINRLPSYGDPVVLDVEILIGANLRGADLSKANLYEADLSRANLRGADLRGACLIRACLSFANLRGAILARADLTRANLSHSDLRGANLTQAVLSRADLTEVKLTGAIINEDTLEVLITRAGRSDGFEFFGFRLTDGSTKIMAGCRWMTPDKYRAHVAAEYPDTDKARETLDIIDFIERRATA